MSIFNFKHHRIWYTKSGEGKEQILFIHNGGNDHRIWDYQVKYFAGKYQVYLMDMLGYGNSDKPDIPYTLDLYTDILNDFVDTVLSPPVILIGNCIGAAQALKLALDYPKKVKALVLCNPATLETMKGGFFGPLYTISQMKYGRLLFRKIARQKITGFLGSKLTFPRLYGKAGEPAGSRDEFRSHVQQLYSKPGNLGILYNLLCNFHTFQQLDTISKPEHFPRDLIIWGEKNFILSASKGKIHSDIVNPTQTKFFSDCGHMVMRERHNEVNQLIETFLG